MKSVQCFSTLQLMPFASRGSDCAQAIRIRMRIEMFNRNVRSKIRSHFSRKDCRSPENRRVDSTAIAPVTGVAHRYRSKWKPIICGALRINAISIACSQNRRLNSDKRLFGAVPFRRLFWAAEFAGSPTFRQPPSVCIFWTANSFPERTARLENGFIVCSVSFVASLDRFPASVDPNGYRTLFVWKFKLRFSAKEQNFNFSHF